MKRILTFIDKHPLIGVAIVIAAFGTASTIDYREQELAAAYDQGVRVGVAAKDDLILQIDSICSKEWPDTDGAALARSRVCNAM